jgi:mRNA-degrading endonuclease RelE of RelBE toxin-antitoxin system
MAQWQFAFKPTFLHELNAFEAKVTQQILKKLDLLAEDPRPDAKTKKQLKNLGGKLHRLRAGDFRIFYTFAEPFVSLLSVKKRDESTYESDVEPEMLGGEIPDTGNADGASRASNVNAWLGPSRPKSSPLPRSVDQSLLVSLGIPEAFHAALVKVATEDDLLDCPVPQDIVDRVIDAVTGKPIAEVARQPDLLLAQPEDLLRYREGELLGFLLRLEPEQEKLAQWALSSKGATLLKGGPGTGKSTVALYRVREILAAWKKQKRTAPKLLFTTYTRALTRISEQLLRSLVGPEGMVHVEVKTADAVLRPMAIAGGSSDHLVSDLRATLARAIENAAFVGTSLKVASQKESVAKLSRDFLLEEILGVIEGRGLSTLDEYLAAVRPGRRVSLAKVQREAVWRVREGERSHARVLWRRARHVPILATALAWRGHSGFGGGRRDLPAATHAAHLDGRQVRADALEPAGANALWPGERKVQPTWLSLPRDTRRGFASQERRVATREDHCARPTAPARPNHSRRATPH